MRGFASSVTFATAAPTTLEHAARQTPDRADSDQCEEHRKLECRQRFFPMPQRATAVPLLNLMWVERERRARIGNYSERIPGWGSPSR
jgi:hypothetical protein